MPRKRNRSHGRLRNYFCTCGSWHTTHTGLQNHIAHYERQPDGRNHEEIEDDDDSDNGESDDEDWDDEDWDDEDWDDEDWDDEDWDDEDWDDDEGCNPENEPPEYEDMPGDTPEDREEAYDNFDWNALD